LTVQTDYLVKRVGVYADYGVLPNPGFALRSAGAGHNATTVLPFNIIDFDAPSFTYTLEAVAYQASPLVYTTNAECSYVYSLKPLVFTWVVMHAYKQALLKF
jgi:hypothetical protein